MELKINVTHAHLEAFTQDELTCSDNPVSKAVLEALRSEVSPWRERIPENAGVDVLRTEGHFWKIALVGYVPKPWDGCVNLWTWTIAGDRAAEDAIDVVMHAGYYDDESPYPFSFTLTLD
ncbi:MAG: hypothetical protein OXC11_14390 [Rhodospirillales bacterium]|nr:hypothetical protein [Rhodospirillales bacterium]